MTALRVMSSSDNAKMGLQMKRRFWKEEHQIFGADPYSSLPVGEFSYLPIGYFTEKGVLLDQSVEARVEPLQSDAAEVHPQVRTQFESAFGVWWKKAKYSGDGYDTGSATSRREPLSRLEDRLVIGSAAVCPCSEPAWQDGAFAAGWQTVKTLHECAMKVQPSRCHTPP